MSLVETISESPNWLIVALAGTVCLISYFFIKWTQMPPGPVGLPYFGYYPFLSDDCSMELAQMSKKYGKVYCFTVTGQQYAHIIDIKTIREIATTKSDCFEKRPANFTLFKDIFGGGVFLSNGEKWKVVRKFFVQQFKEFGMGRRVQEGMMQDCLKKIVSSLNQSGGKDFGSLEFFTGLANDVVMNMIFGNAKLNENDVIEFHSSYMVCASFSNGTKILLNGPFLKYFLLNFAPAYRNYRKHAVRVESIIGKIIRQHEREFDRNNIRNLVDAYINEKRSLEEKQDPKAKFFTERCLMSSLLQFFGDGTLGVGWLSSAILEIISSRPDVQKAVQSEVDEVIGRNRLPSWDDKSKLPYTNATIYEGLRTIKFVPIFPAMECTKETTVGGCRISKGTVVVQNLWAAFHDAEMYDEPDKFDPTRFLSVDGKKPKAELPPIFGVGKRSCVGESLTSMELLLYITTVLQNFDLHPVDESLKYSEEPNILIRATPRVS